MTKKKAVANSETVEQLAKAMAEIGTLRERLDVLLEERDRAMQDLHDEGYGYEAIARMAGDISHVGVFRALKRRDAKDLAEVESA